MADSMLDSKNNQIRGQGQMLMWAAEKVLTEEQIEILLQSIKNSQ